MDVKDIEREIQETWDRHEKKNLERLRKIINAGLKPGCKKTCAEIVAEIEAET
jgi:hypothetical protein